MYLAWITIVMAVLGVGYAYLGWRLIATARLAATWKRCAWPGLALLFVLTLLVVRDLLWLVSLGMEKGALLSKKRFLGSPAAPMDPSRRAFLFQMSNAGVLAIAGVLTAYGIHEARRRPGIVNLTIPVPGLPEEFAGFRIVQEVRALRPDLIAFTGDLADGTVAHLRDDVAPFGELQAPLGKFFVTGNHEYYSGAEAWVEESRRLGYDVLLNEHRLVHRGGSALALAGVTDFTGGRFLPHHRSDPGAAIGQPYLSGLHRHKGTWVYVSRGTGYWGPPVRLGARSEITVFTLARENGGTT